MNISTAGQQATHDDAHDAARAGDFDVVSVALTRYDHYPQLSGSRADGTGSAEGEAASVAETLEEFGGRPVPWGVLPPRRDVGAVERRLEAWATPDRPRNTVLHWVGHSWSNDVRARLVLPESSPVTANGMEPERLADYIRAREARMASGDSWAAVMIDGCRSARFAELLHATLLKDDPHAPTRVLVLGVSREGETRLGAFSEALRLSFASFQGSNEVPLWDLADQLRQRLPGSFVFPPNSNGALRRRLPVVSGASAPLDIYEDLTAFLRSLSPDERLHLIPQARSSEHGDAAWYFVGRSAEKKRITAWLRNGTQGMLVVTGEGGQGKSALLGHIAALSRPRLRELLLRGNYITPPPEAETPPDHAFDGIVHATGTDRRTIIETIASAAGYPPEMLALHNPDDLTESLKASLSARDRPFTVLVDALDEADDPRGVAEVLQATAALPGCQILVGTRPFERHPAGGQPTDLLDALAPDGFEEDDLVILTSDSDAVFDYVRLRLAGARHVKLDRSERDHAARVIAAQDPDFLGARLAVHEVLSRAGEEEHGRLARTLRDLVETGLKDDALFEAALTRIVAESTAAAPLLRALALSEGRGLPRAGGVWAAAASGIAGRTVTERDIDVLLRVAAPYVLIDAEDGRPVFRLSHEVFRELMDGHPTGGEPMMHSAEWHHRIAVGLADAARLRRHERTRDPEDRLPARYVRRFWTEHASRGGRLDALLATYPELLPHLDGHALERHRSEVASATVRSMLLAVDLARPGPGATSSHSSAEVGLWASRLGERRLAAACADGNEAAMDPAPSHRSPWTLKGAWWTGVHARELPKHPTGVTAVCAGTVDGAGVIVSAGADGSLRVDGPRSKFRGPALLGPSGSRPSAVALVEQPAGSPLVLAHGGARLYAWNHRGKEIALRTLSVTAFALAVGGNGLIAATDDAEIRYWDRPPSAAPWDTEGREEPTGSRRVGWHHDTVLALAAAEAPGGAVLLSGSADHSARLWSLRDGTLRHVLSHTAPVRAVVLGAAGRQLLAATATANPVVELWDAASGNRLHRLALPAAARCVAFGRMSGRPVLLIGCDDGHLRVWDARTGTPELAVPCHTGPVTALAVHHPGGREQYVTGGADGRVRVWDVRRIRESRRSRHVGGIHAMCWSTRSDGRREVVTAAEGHTDVVVRTASDGRILRSVTPVAAGVRSLLPYGQAGYGRVVVLDNDGVPWTWDPEAGTTVRIVGAQGAIARPLTTVAFGGPKDPWLACADVDGTVRFIDLSGPNRGPAPRAGGAADDDEAAPERRIDPLTLERAAVRRRRAGGESDGPDPSDGFRLPRPLSLIEYHAGHVVAYYGDGSLQAWDRAGRRTVWSARPSEAPADALATGRWAGGQPVVVLGTEDGTVHIHSLLTGTDLARARLHDGPVRALTVSPGEQPLVVSGGEDGKVVLWGADDERLTLTGHAEAVRSVIFDPRPAALATGGAQGTLSLWGTRR